MDTDLFVDANFNIVIPKQNLNLPILKLMVKEFSPLQGNFRVLHALLEIFVLKILKHTIDFEKEFFYQLSLPSIFIMLYMLHFRSFVIFHIEILRKKGSFLTWALKMWT